MLNISLNLPLRQILLLTVVSLLAGCVTTIASMSVGTEAAQTLALSTKGHHDQVADEFFAAGGFASIEPNDDGDWYRLSFVCSSFFEMRDHDNFAKCGEKLFSLPVPKGVNKYSNEYDMRAGELSTLALLSIDLGEHERALHQAQEGLELLEQGKNRYPQVPFLRLCSAGGIAAARLGRLDEARGFAELALENHIDEAYPKYGLARKRWTSSIYFAMQDYAAVIDLANTRDNSKDLQNTVDAVFSLGLSVVVNKAMENFLDDWSTFDNLPLNYMVTKSLLETGDIEKAREALDEALDTDIIENFGYVYPYILQDRAQIAVADGDQAYAIELLKKSVDSIEEQRSSLTTETSRIGFAGDKQSIYANLIALLVQEQAYAQAFEFAERAKSRALVDMLADKKTIRSNELTAEESRQLLAELDSQVLRSNFAARTVSNSQKTRSANTASGNALMSKADAEFTSLVSVQTATAQDIWSKLQADEVLLEYYRHGDQLFVFVVKPGEVHAVELQGAAVERQVRGFRRSLSKANSYDYKDRGETLYRQVVAPVEHLLDENKLLVVPHGALHYVPFAALFDGDTYLSDRYQLRVLPSASVLSFLDQEQAPNEGSLLVLGNPDLKNPEFDLPGAEQEAQHISAQVDNAKILLREQANESALRRFGPMFENIHFAMHGEFNDEEPLNSGLLMSADDAHDGRLTVGELYDLKLNTNLVTLSACETGLGKTASGDDVVGFTRGFLYAGAESIVSSLWQVSDQATRDLMTNFYTNLPHHDKGRALQLAQHEIRESYPHPYYWAAFQLTGSN